MLTNGVKYSACIVKEDQTSNDSILHKKALRNQMIQLINNVLYFSVNHEAYNLIVIVSLSTKFVSVINKWISKTASI